MRFWKSLISSNGEISSKNFTLITSSVVSAVIGVCVCFVMCWDVIHNSYVKTDMEGMGIFMLCMGGYLAGGSVSKVFQYRMRGRKIRPYVEDMNEMDEPPYNREPPYYEDDDEPIYGASNKKKKEQSDD